MILEKLLIPGEDLAQLRQLADNLNETWHPADLKEKPFVDQLIYHTWLVERLRGVEARIWAEGASEKTEKRAAGIQRMIALQERAISRATRDLIYLKKVAVRHRSLPVAQELPEQTQFEAEIASWSDGEEEKQSQIEYPPVPKGANEAQFPTAAMKSVGDWRNYRKK